MLPTLHLVTDDSILASPDFIARAERLMDEGGPAVALHLRGYDLTGADLWTRAEACAAIAGRTGSWLVINDRVDVAIGCGAAAVQLGWRSLPPGAVRRIVGEGVKIGVSAHDIEQVATVRGGGADFLVAGTVYCTPTHPRVVPSGVGWIAEAAATGLPVIAIGGITTERVAEVREAGAYGVAVIRAVWRAPDPVTALDDLLKALA